MTEFLLLIRDLRVLNVMFFFTMASSMNDHLRVRLAGNG